jgi:hypothetical protein
VDFHFRNLSPEDFEEVAQDIISVDENSIFERFKRGKDQSIDLRLLKNQSSIICQVKHMLGSYGSTHKSTFKKELEKAATVKAAKFG